MSGQLQGAAQGVSGQLFREYYSADLSDADRAIQRWEEWMALREQARENHLKSGSTQPLPKALADEPPPRPEPYVEEEMTDVSVDITANGFDASESFTLDRSMADDIVPASDPGLDRPVVSDVTGLPQSRGLIHSPHRP